MDMYKCMKCGFTNSIYIEIFSTNSDKPYTFEFIYVHQDQTMDYAKTSTKKKLKVGHKTSHGSRRIIYCSSCGSPIIHRHFEEAPF